MSPVVICSEDQMRLCYLKCVLILQDINYENVSSRLQTITFMRCALERMES